MEPPVLQELPIEVRNTLRSGVIIPNIAQCIVELILNSLDAGASSIAIRVNLVYHKIQVVDNGCGIDLASLNLVGLRYMTSKCNSLEDLRKYLGLFGFRGEALASLRNVSKVIIIESRPHNCDDTFYKVFKKGKSQAAVKSNSKRPSRGTTVTVHDFLYNMPVRQQRTNDAIDLEEIKCLIEAIALIHSDVSFSLRNDVNGNIILHAQRTYDKLKTFASLFGDEITKSLVLVKHSSSKFKIKGFISREAHTQKHLQFIYVNKRVVKKTKLHSATNAKLAQSSIRFGDHSRPNLKRKSNGNWIAYTPPTKRDKFPVYLLNIKCAAIEYDICSDPKKTLIEFLDWSSVLKCLDEALQKFLEAEGLVETKEEKCAAVELPVADRSAIDALRRCEGPVLEIGRCIRSRPALRKKTSNDTDTKSPVSPSQSLVDILGSNGPDVQGLGADSPLAASVNAECQSPDALGDGTESSRASVSSNRISVPMEAEFTPAPPVHRCPSEDPFPSSFGKLLPRKRIQEPKVKKRWNSSLSSLSEDPIGQAKARESQVKRARRSLRSSFRSLSKRPLKLKDSLSEDPLNGSDCKQYKTQSKYISRRKELLNQVTLAAPRVPRSKPVVCRASLCSFAPCDKGTPANSEAPRVHHVFCHPLLTNVDDNPDFVRLQDAVTMDRLSIVLKKCAARLKPRGVLRIRETEITVNQRVGVTQEMAKKTPEEIVNGLKSPYFSLAKAKDFVFKIPKVKNPVFSAKAKQNERAESFILKPAHRSPYFTSPPDTAATNKNNVQFIFRPQLATDYSPKFSSPVSEHYRLNVAPKGKFGSREPDNQPTANRQPHGLALPCQLSPLPEMLGNCNQEFHAAEGKGRCGIDGRRQARQDRRRPMTQYSPEELYVTSSDMIQPLHRSVQWTHHERGAEDQAIPSSKEHEMIINQKRRDQRSPYVPATLSDRQIVISSPVLEAASTASHKTETFPFPAPISQPRSSDKPHHALSPICEDRFEDSSDVNYKKLWSIERKYHCFSSRGGVDGSPEPDRVSMDACSGACSSHALQASEQEQSLISNNILFPRTEVVFVSSDESSDHEKAGNELPDNAAQKHLARSDRYSRRTEQCLADYRGVVSSQRLRNEDDDEHIDSRSDHEERSSDTRGVAIALGVSENDSGIRSVHDELDLDIHICNTPSFDGDEDIIPDTPAPQASGSITQHAFGCKILIQETTEEAEIDREWKQMFDGNGRAFFVHVRSGMTSFDPPAPIGQGIAMTKRYCFLPKGMSPILEDKANGEKTKDLSQTSREKVQKAVLDAGQAQEELAIVKWRDNDGQDGSILGKILEFAEKNGKYCEAPVPNAFIQERKAVKSYNLISSYTLTKDIFTCINLLGQLDKKFIVAIVNPSSNGLPNLLVFFDQHAVHERVRLEKLMKDYHLEGSDTHFKSTPIQPPIPITLSEQEARMVSSFGDEIRRVGLEIVASSSVATDAVVKCVPKCVKLRVDRDAACRRQESLQSIVETLVREMVSLLLEARGVSARVPATLQNIINSEACRGAIKFGDVLSKEDCLRLLTELCQCDLPFQCAHGRPSVAPIADLREIVRTDKVMPAPNYRNLKKYLD